jgi:hypothetical protein
MSLEYKTFKDIKEGDLQQLIDNKIPEGITIDYKELLNVQKPKDKKEFLQDISAFANTQGGCIIYGMKEEKSVASELCGITLENADVEIQKLDNLIRDGIEPRIYGTQIKTVKLSNSSKCALVIWIPRSFNPPHMVIIDGHRKFYGRNSSGKYPLSVEELRILFGLADEITKRAREFCYDRIFKIKSGQAPVLLLEGPKYVLHLIPFGSFKPASNYDLSEFYKDPKKLTNIRWENTLGNGRYNFDGFVSCCCNAYSSNTRPTYVYTQIFRNGIIEAVDMEYNPTLNDKVDKVVDINYKDTIIKAIKEYLGIQKTLGITPPIFIIFSILGVKGVPIGQRDSTTPKLEPVSGSGSFTQDDLILPEIILSDFDDNKIEQQMHQIFDVVRNAAGLPSNTI